MGDAKRIIIKPISSKDANRIIKSLHYSGRVTQNSQLHLGVFLDGKCGGALQFGPSLNKRNMVGLVKGTLWNEFLELNRMALADWLPKNGESRSISQAMRFIKKKYPHIKWIVSFADGTQCGDGTIYRASGFYLLAVKKNNSLYRLQDGRVINNLNMTGKYLLTELKKDRRVSSSKSYQVNARAIGAEVVEGFQIKYIYFLHPEEKENLTVPILPFSAIDKAGARMYLGGKQSSAGSSKVEQPAIQQEEGGAVPTSALHFSEVSE